MASRLFQKLYLRHVMPAKGLWDRRRCRDCVRPLDVYDDLLAPEPMAVWREMVASYVEWKKTQ